MTSEQLDFERRKSSVDNLERLYTVVAALALTTAVGQLLRESATGELADAVVRIANIDVYYATLPMFLTLIVTLIPFYHGANRYLYENYVFITHDANKPDARSGGSVALIDFLFFFVQSLLFYLMSLIMREAIWYHLDPARERAPG